MDKKKVKSKIEEIIWYITTEFPPSDTLITMKHLAEEAIKELSKSDWLSVEDGLPEYGENVLAISKDGNMNVSYRRKITRDKISPDVMDDNGFILNFNLCCSKITHWKPIEKLEE